MSLLASPLLEGLVMWSGICRNPSSQRFKASLNCLSLFRTAHGQRRINQWGIRIALGLPSMVYISHVCLDDLADQARLSYEALYHSFQSQLRVIICILGAIIAFNSATIFKSKYCLCGPFLLHAKHTFEFYRTSCPNTAGKLPHPQSALW